MNGSGATSSGQSGGTGIAVDGSGRAYVGGYVNTVADYKTTSGAFQTTSDETLNGNDAFFAQLKADGSGLDYSTLFSGEDEDDALALAIDPAGVAYLTGFTYSNSLPTNAGAFQPTFTGCCGQWAAWVAKFDPSQSGNASRVYATYLGTSNFGNAIAADASGHAYVTGSTSGSFPVTAGAFQTTHGGDVDAFVAKLGTGGGSLQYATYLGGSDYDNGYGIAVDGSGSAYVTGVTSSDDFPVGGRPLFATRQGGEDAFVTRVFPAGAGLSYSTYLGGSADERANAIALDTAGDAHVAGRTSSDGQASANAFQTARGGGQDAFFAKLIHTTRTVVSCTPGTIDIAQPTTCTATVTDSFNPPTTPTGTITFTASGAGVFAPAVTCALVAGAAGTASCSRIYTPSATGAQTVTAAYGGDDGHAPSDGKDGIGVGTRPTQASLSCQPVAIRVAQAATCTLTVDDVGTGTASTPMGTVTFSGTASARSPMREAARSRNPAVRSTRPARSPTRQARWPTASTRSLRCTAAARATARATRARACRSACGRQRPRCPACIPERSRSARPLRALSPSPTPTPARKARHSVSPPSASRAAMAPRRAARCRC